MTLSSSLSNAVSGLTAVSRAAELVSSNVANSTTQGYGRREISLASVTNGVSGAGVRVSGVERVVDQVAQADRRLADASFGHDNQIADFFLQLENALGTPDDPFSLTARTNNLETSLLEAAARPDSQSRLGAVVDAAKSVADGFNEVADDLQQMRQQADQAIYQQIEQVNSALKNIEDLNTKIRIQVAAGGEPAALMDERQLQIDKITPIIPLREISRDYGQIALMTVTGTTLLDSTAATISFQSTPIITPDMSLEAGSLSGIEIIGAASNFGDDYTAISGGKLQALFDIRDVLSVDAQTQLDALSRDLVERFSDPTLDSTITPGNPGIFTDAGGAFDPLNEENLSGRLRINAAIDPVVGGQLWRLRDGVEATDKGPSGENALLNALSATLSENRTPSSGNFISAGSHTRLIADFLSDVGQSRQSTQSRQAFASAELSGLRDVELRSGVDTDQEMQKLLLIEQAYAANAKVIQTIDEMMQSILRI